MVEVMLLWVGQELAQVTPAPTSRERVGCLCYGAGIPHSGPHSSGCFVQEQPALGSIQPGHLVPMICLDLGLVPASPSARLHFLPPPWGLGGLCVHS